MESSFLWGSTIFSHYVQLYIEIHIHIHIDIHIDK